jgi:hypothetical protein
MVKLPTIITPFFILILIYTLYSCDKIDSQADSLTSNEEEKSEKKSGNGDNPENTGEDDTAAQPKGCQVFIPFEICEELENECTFYALTKDSSCASYCQNYGGNCIAAYYNVNESTCDIMGESTCDEPAGDQICTCTLPP